MAERTDLTRAPSRLEIRRSHPTRCKCAPERAQQTENGPTVRQVFSRTFTE